MSGYPQSLWAERAWLNDGWATNVLLHIGADGRWSHIEPDVTQPPPDAQRITGPLLPSIVNAHSHAFQRAFAGLAERRENEHDDFWSWRDRMYRVALRITPDQLRAIAAQLFVELLQGGYTQVCEFHYLQHDANGRPYADPHAMAWAIADAADAAGIGLTLMPALYERAGFDAPAQRAGAGAGDRASAKAAAARGCRRAFASGRGTRVCP
jgi:formimidoylglutamate deiminase